MGQFGPYWIAGPGTGHSRWDVVVHEVDFYSPTVTGGGSLSVPVSLNPGPAPDYMRMPLGAGGAVMAPGRITFGGFGYYGTWDDTLGRATRAVIIEHDQGQGLVGVMPYTTNSALGILIDSVATMYSWDGAAATATKLGPATAGAWDFNSAVSEDFVGLTPFVQADIATPTRPGFRAFMVSAFVQNSKYYYMMGGTYFHPPNVNSNAATSAALLTSTSTTVPTSRTVFEAGAIVVAGVHYVTDFDPYIDDGTDTMTAVAWSGHPVDYDGLHLLPTSKHTSPIWAHGVVDPIPSPNMDWLYMLTASESLVSVGPPLAYSGSEAWAGYGTVYKHPLTNDIYCAYLCMNGIAQGTVGRIRLWKATGRTGSAVTWVELSSGTFTLASTRAVRMAPIITARKGVMFFLVDTGASQAVLLLYYPATDEWLVYAGIEPASTNANYGRIMGTEYQTGRRKPAQWFHAYSH